MLSEKIIIITIIDKRIIIMYNIDTKKQSVRKIARKSGNKNKSTLKRENDYEKI